MPGHFTHIYTARRVADHLLRGEIPDWPTPIPELEHLSPRFCGAAMKRWEKFTAIGAIGPDLFYFSQDYNSPPLGKLSDDLMLALKIYYYFDAAKEDDWESLLIILDGVSSSMAQLLRLLIKLQKIWQSLVDGWNATIGPIVDSAADLADALTGGVLSEFKVVLEELKLALVKIGEEELLTFKDIFTMFDTCVQKGFDEQSFLWSDMSHYRKPSALCRALVQQALALRDGEDGEARFEQFLAFALGYITHVGTDTVAHSFVNEQCGGPFRNHPQRHHLIENHIDAYNYGLTRAGEVIPSDPWGATDTYPDLSMSALWFAVQLTPDDPAGQQRPDTLPDDPAERKKALDVDGEMPDWMAQSIVKALIATFADGPHPRIYGGSSYQSAIDQAKLADLIFQVTGQGMDRPFSELLDGIAPPPDFDVPEGFPLPWQIQTIYLVMISFYKFSYTGSWELQKPRKPDFIIMPPAGDVQAVLQPPDFSGVDSSNPVVDVCEAIVAFFEWVGKEIGAALQLVDDLIRMIASPASYPIRLALYELAMMVWDVVVKTHEVLAHTGFSLPHGEQRYDDNGELRLPNEIDLPLITLGGTVDSAFKQALADAADPMGNLDKSVDAIGIGHLVTDPYYPYYPVLRKHVRSDGTVSELEGWEFRRPWAYPNVSLTTFDGKTDIPTPTPTETYDPHATDPDGPSGAYRPLRPGPFRLGARPEVFFRVDQPVDVELRRQYELAQSPWQTDRLNEAHLVDSPGSSPLGDPIPFSSYLIGRIANDTGYTTQFNLDSDRAFAYLTWDWKRMDARQGDGAYATTELGFRYLKPVVAPEGSADWALGKDPLQLLYVDKPALPPAPPPIK
ncbi:MAG: zinc dependent phospholipase C family protein [Burkholderiales bacterium]|nr:zinc dependent phospholipase C family protein [Burkholderiales bacterium]